MIYLEGVKRLSSCRFMGESEGETFDSLLLLLNGRGGEERLEFFFRYGTLLNESEDSFNLRESLDSTSLFLEAFLYYFSRLSSSKYENILCGLGFGGDSRLLNLMFLLKRLKSSLD